MAIEDLATGAVTSESEAFDGIMRSLEPYVVNDVRDLPVDGVAAANGAPVNDAAISRSW